VTRSGWALVFLQLLATASNWRTYLLRTVIAGFGVMLLAVVIGLDRISGADGAQSVLGLGNQVFWLVAMLAIGVTALLTPLVIINHLPMERERGNLDLLLATPVPRLLIVVAGVAGSLAGILSLLLMLIPLGAIAYSLGGVSLNQAGNVLVTLLAIGVNFAAVACWAGSDPRAQRQAWARCISTLLLISHAALPCMVGIGCMIAHHYGVADSWLAVHGSPYGAMFCLERPPWLNLLGLTPIWLVSWFYIRLASRSLDGNPLELNDASAPRERRYVPRTLRPVPWWRRTWAWSRPPSNLPEDSPIAWLEAIQAEGRGTVLSQPRAHGCVLIALSLALVFVVCHAGTIAVMSGWIWLLGWLGWIQVMINAASRVPVSRATSAHALLTILPRSSASILREQAASAARFVPWYSAIVLGSTVTGLILSLIWPTGRNELLLRGMAALTLLAASIWPAFGLAQFARTRTQATLAAWGAMLLWAAFPCMINALIRPLYDIEPWWLIGIVALSPLHLLDPAAVSNGDWHLRVALSIILFAGLGATARWWVLARADRILGRAA
jgi:ABC-type transport system involved in multi-copper enzyme maturation permease subunit